VQLCIYDYRNNFVPSTTYNALAPVVNNNLHLYGMAQAELGVWIIAEWNLSVQRVVPSGETRQGNMIWFRSGH